MRWRTPDYCQLSLASFVRRRVLRICQEGPPVGGGDELLLTLGEQLLEVGSLAQRVEWPLDVFVPTWMSDEVGELLERLGARITTCARRAGTSRAASGGAWKVKGRGGGSG